MLAADKAILDTLSNPELEATVFAPNDKAFERLLKDLKLSKEELLKDKALVTQVRRAACECRQTLWHERGGHEVMFVRYNGCARHEHWHLSVTARKSKRTLQPACLCPNHADGHCVAASPPRRCCCTTCWACPSPAPP